MASLTGREEWGHFSYRFHGITPEVPLIFSPEVLHKPLPGKQGTSSISLTVLKVYNSYYSFAIPVSTKDSNMLT